MIELKGEDYTKFVEGLDNLQLINELIKQTVTYHHLAMQDIVTEDDTFRYNVATTTVYNRMNKEG